jgi:hypothetical protein
MQTFVRPTILATKIAICAPAPLLAKPAAASPYAGTWKLDLPASSFGSHPEKSETRIYQVTGNKVVLKSMAVDGAGKPANYHYTATIDGKPYPLVGNPIGDSIALKWVNPRSVAATVKKGPRLVSTSTSTVSPDGERLTLTRKYPGGKLADDVTVYDKQ